VIVAEARVPGRQENFLTRPIRLIHVPMWLGAEVFGAHLGPEAIDAGLRQRWSRQDHDYPQLHRRLLPPVIVPVPAPDHALSRIDRRSLEFVSEIVASCERVAELVSVVIARGELPVVLGGDHSVSWGSVAGAARAAETLGVIWIDAHPDINTPESSRSGHIHGMPLAYLVGLCGPNDGASAVGSCLRPENLCYLGLRDIDPFERQVITDLGIRMVTTEEWMDVGIERGLAETLAHLGANGVDAVHVSFDLDVLDPHLLPGTGTPVDGGLDIAAAAQVLRWLHTSDAPIHSVDIVELNPLLDQSGGSTHVAVGLLATLLGELMRE
jgi:arginase